MKDQSLKTTVIIKAQSKTRKYQNPRDSEGTQTILELKASV